jgi:hypothetical protein
MAIVDDGRHSRFHRSEQREASVLFLLAYPFCLVAAIAHRLAPGVARATPRQSIFGEARSSARGIIPFTFR